MNRRNAVLFLLLLLASPLGVAESALTSGDALVGWLESLVIVADPLAGVGEASVPFPLFFEDLDRGETGWTDVLDPVETVSGEDTELARSD